MLSFITNQLPAIIKTASTLISVGITAHRAYREYQRETQQHKVLTFTEAARILVERAIPIIRTVADAFSNYTRESQPAAA